jgi:hypothetical protein
VNLEGNGPLGRPRHRREDNIKMDIRMGYKCVNWINLAQGRARRWAVVNMVINLRVP